MSLTPAPAHLGPERCYVCGHRAGQHTDADGHAFWSNADAARDLAAETPLSVGYPCGSTSPEEAYVAEYRPY